MEEGRQDGGEGVENWGIGSAVSEGGANGEGTSAGDAAAGVSVVSSGAEGGAEPGGAGVSVGSGAAGVSVEPNAGGASVVSSGAEGGAETGAPEPSEADRLRGELTQARAQAVASHRRALLAENAGRVVPELVTGETVEALEASVEVARRAFEAVRQVVVADLGAAAQVGGSNGARGPVVDVESMTPVGKIAYGLRPTRE